MDSGVYSIINGVGAFAPNRGGVQINRCALGGMVQWLGRRSLVGRLSLTCAWSVVDR